MGMRTSLLALVIGAFATLGNPAAAGELDAETRARIEEMRGEAMAKLVLLDEPRELPAAEFEAPDGAAATLADFGGHVTLVNLWATWCPPCREEMPSLDALRRRMEGTGIEVITVAVQPGARDKAEAYMAEMGLHALEPYGDARNALPRAVGILGLPTTIILSPEGREIARMQGDADWASPEAEAVLRALAEAFDADG